MHAPSHRKTALSLILLAGLAGAAFFGFRSESPAPATAPDADITQGTQPRPEPAPDQDSPPSAASASSRHLPADSPNGVAFLLELARAGWDVEALLERAKSDTDFALDLALTSSLCTLIAGRSSEADSRFADPRWQIYIDRCEQFPWQRLREESLKDEWNTGPAEWNAMMEEIAQLPEDDPERRALLRDILRSSTDMSQLQVATMLYFNSTYARSLAGNDPHAGMSMFHSGDSMVEAAMYIGCQVHPQRCSWDSPLVLQECAITRHCFPGHSMSQIIALRRSPLEMELLQLLSEDIAELRRRP